MILDKINIHKKVDDFSDALIFEKTKLSYQELKSQILSAAHFFSLKGIKKKDYCTILFDNNIEFIISVLGLWQLKAIPIPINTKLVENEINEIINFTGSKFLITDRKQKYSAQNIIDFSVRILSANEIEESAPGKFDFDLESTSVIIFTSGSAGSPKGVVLSFKSLIQSSVTGNQILDQSKNDRWLASLPFYHIGGFSIIFRAIFYGASIILPSSLNIDDIFSSLKKSNPTLASFVSTQLKRLLEINAVPNKELRKVLLGGGFIENYLIENAEKNGWKIFKVYGSSETSSFVSAADYSEIKNKFGTVGKPLYPNKIFIFDQNGNEAPKNNFGEIVVESPALFSKYLNNPDETKNQLKNNRYFSGDIGRIDGQGYVFIEARRIDLIITGGENVNPREVESVLLQLNEIDDCCVAGIEDKEWGHKVAAALVVNKKISAEKIKDFLKGKIADFKIPKKIIFVDHLPKTSLGKIRREKVKELINSLT